MGVEEGLRPVGRVLGHSLFEPFRFQIVAERCTLLGIHLKTVVLPGVWTEDAPLLRVLALDETDAAASDAWVLHDDALRDVLHLIGLAEVALDIEDVVVDCHTHLQHLAADDLSSRLYRVVDRAAADFNHHILGGIINEEPKWLIITNSTSITLRVILRANECLYFLSSIYALIPFVWQSYEKLLKTPTKFVNLC